MLLKEKVKQSLNEIISRIRDIPKVGVVLGSGMGDFARHIQHPVVIPASDIPHYPISTVPGHEGRLLFGQLENVPVVCVQGRVHYYEGYSLQHVTYYVHVLASLGVDTLFLTTASGGLNPSFEPGNLMLMTDQLNFTLTNPLIGPPDDQLGPRFPDMSQPFDPGLQQRARAAADKVGLNLREGVFCWVTGPNYETAAEVRALQKLGGDAVSMSTAPEVIVARQRHLKVLGLSLITNMSTGISKVELTHQDVTRMAGQAGSNLQNLMREMIAGLKE